MRPEILASDLLQLLTVNFETGQIWLWEDETGDPVKITNYDEKAVWIDEAERATRLNEAATVTGEPYQRNHNFPVKYFETVKLAGLMITCIYSAGYFDVYDYVRDYVLENAIGRGV